MHVLTLLRVTQFSAPFERHEAYVGRFSEFDEDSVHEVRSGLELLQALCDKYGKISKYFFLLTLNDQSILPCSKILVIMLQ